MPFVFVCIGLLAGISSGLFGIGGGILVVPALAFFAGYTQEMAVGTSLAVLLPPVGLAAVLQYYRQGDVDLRGAAWVAGGLFLGAWAGSLIALRAGEARMKLAFGVFVIGLGLWITAAAIKGLHLQDH